MEKTIRTPLLEKTENRDQRRTQVREIRREGKEEHREERTEGEGQERDFLHLQISLSSRVEKNTFFRSKIRLN